MVAFLWIKVSKNGTCMCASQGEDCSVRSHEQGWEDGLYWLTTLSCCRILMCKPVARKAPALLQWRRRRLPKQSLAQ